MYFYTSLSLGLLAITQLVAGHGAIIKAVGDAGGAGAAVGGMFRIVSASRFHIDNANS
jgi:hypothetical protein